MDYPIWILIAVLLGTAWTLPTDKGPQTFNKRSPEPKPQPKAQPEPQPQPQPDPKPQQQYQEVLMYLTPSQIRHLEQTQHEHGFILPTAQDQSQAEGIEEQLLYQQQNRYLGQQLISQNPTDLEQYLNQQEASDMHQKIVKEQSRQQEQKYLQQQDSRQIEQQLLKEQMQEVEEQYQKRLEASQFEEELLKQRSKEMEELFIKEQEARELERQLMKQTKIKPLEFNPNMYLEQLKNSTQQNKNEQKNKIQKNNEQKNKEQKNKEQKNKEQKNNEGKNNERKNKESSQNQKQQSKNVVRASPNSPYETYAPQLLYAPSQGSYERQTVVEHQPQLQQQTIVEPQPQLQQQTIYQQQPQLQYVYVDANRVSQSTPLNELRQQVLLQPQSQILQPIQQIPEEQQPIELQPQPNVHQNYQLIPYQYIPEQQEVHQLLGQKLLENQLYFQNEAQKELESGLKLNQKNEEVQKLSQQIYEHQLLQQGPALRQYEIQREPLQLIRKPTTLELINQEKAEILHENKQFEADEVEEKATPLFPVDKIPENAHTLQELQALDFLHKISHQEKQNQNLLTHLDLLNEQNKFAHLQYAAKYKDQKFTLEEIERVIKNIQIEKQRANKLAEAIAKSPPQVIRQDIKVTKRPIEYDNSKWRPIPAPYSYTVPQPYLVKYPQPFPVPFEILKPYPVPIVKTEKVEVEKPVPIEVEKRVPVEVEKKLYVHINKPYTVERIVPYQIKKEIPVEVPIYKPKKLHIIRHVW